MKIFTSLLIATLFALNCYAGGPTPPTVTIMPTDPEVGETVTFTLDPQDFNIDNCFIEISPNATTVSLTGGRIAATAKGPVRLEFDDPGVATFVFSGVGEYRLEGTCANPSGSNVTPITFFPGSSISVSEAVEPSAIPTLGEWGLIILCLIMLGLGMVYLGQRQRNTQGIS